MTITSALLLNGGMSQKAAEPHEGPGEPVEPGTMSPQSFQRGLITEGHQAPSPGHDPRPAHVHVPEPGTMRAGEPVMPGSVPHVDATASRAMIQPVHPGTAAAAGGDRPC